MTQPLIVPPGPITQPYGPTSETLEPSYLGYPHFHQGVDIGLPVGTPLPAGGAGVVTGEPNQGQTGLGLQVIIDLGNGLVETLGHLVQAVVSVGQRVTAGQTVGYSGGAPGSPTSGASTGPHVHIATTQNGVFEDPTTASVPTQPIFGSNPEATLTGGVIGVTGVPSSAGVTGPPGGPLADNPPTLIPKTVTRIDAAIASYAVLMLMAENQKTAPFAVAIAWSVALAVVLMTVSKPSGGKSILGQTFPQLGVG